MRTQAEEVELWSAFARRVTLSFPFQVDILVSPHNMPEMRSFSFGRAMMGVQLHVLDRDTREPITVLTRRPCAAWTSDEDAANMLFDLLEIALRHETFESVRIDGKLVRDLHGRS